MVRLFLLPFGVHLCYSVLVEVLHLVVKKGKTRRMFTLSDEVLQALAKRALEEKIKGKLRSLHGAESRIVEEALRQYLGVKEGEKNG